VRGCNAIIDRLVLR